MAETERSEAAVLTIARRYLVKQHELVPCIDG